MMRFHVYLYMFVCVLLLISLLCTYDMTGTKGTKGSSNFGVFYIADVKFELCDTHRTWSWNLSVRYMLAEDAVYHWVWFVDFETLWSRSCDILTYLSLSPFARISLIPV